MTKKTTTRKWYELLPWWGWILAGLFSTWVGNTLDTSGSMLEAIIIAGVSCFGLIAIITGIVRAIRAFFRWRNTLPKQY